MVQESFDVQRDLKEETGVGRRVVCLACCQVIFEVPDMPTESQRQVETVRLAAHLEFAHDMITRRFKECSIPKCQSIHVEAFHKLGRRKEDR